jgi:hypothetical protein
MIFLAAVKANATVHPSRLYSSIEKISVQVVLPHTGERLEILSNDEHRHKIGVEV